MYIMQKKRNEINQKMQMLSMIMITSLFYFFFCKGCHTDTQQKTIRDSLKKKMVMIKTSTTNDDNEQMKKHVMSYVCLSVCLCVCRVSKFKFYML